MIVINIVILSLLVFNMFAQNNGAALIIYDQNFENGAADWITEGGTWTVQQDDFGNSFYCVTTSEQARAYPPLPVLSDFVLDLDILINQPNGEIVLRQQQAISLSYAITDNSVTLSREDGWIAAEEGYPFPLGDWISTRTYGIERTFEFQIDDTMTFLAIIMDDKFINQGQFALGASGNADICFDNFVITYIER